MPSIASRSKRKQQQHRESDFSTSSTANGSSSASASPTSSPSSLSSSLRRIASAFRLGKRKESPVVIEKEQSQQHPQTSSISTPPTPPSASPPPLKTPKRARIAAPDTLGAEESRQLLALVDSPQQPEWMQRRMVEDLERRAEGVVEQRADPLDDDEVDGSLGAGDGGAGGGGVGGDGAGARDAAGPSNAVVASSDSGGDRSPTAALVVAPSPSSPPSPSTSSSSTSHVECKGKGKARAIDVDVEAQDEEVIGADAGAQGEDMVGAQPNVQGEDDAGTGVLSHSDEEARRASRRDSGGAVGTVDADDASDGSIGATGASATISGDIIQEIDGASVRDQDGNATAAGASSASAPASNSTQSLADQAVREPGNDDNAHGVVAAIAKASQEHAESVGSTNDATKDDDGLASTTAVGEQAVSADKSQDSVAMLQPDIIAAQEPRQLLPNGTTSSAKDEFLQPHVATASQADPPPSDVAATITADDDAAPPSAYESYNRAVNADFDPVGTLNDNGAGAGDGLYPVLPTASSTSVPAGPVDVEREAGDTSLLLDDPLRNYLDDTSRDQEAPRLNDNTATTAAAKATAATERQPDSADALTEEVQPVEVDMLSGERDGIRGVDPKCGGGDVVEEVQRGDGDENEEDEVIQISADLPNGLIVDVADDEDEDDDAQRPPLRQEGVARQTLELGEVEDVVVEPQSESQPSQDDQTARHAQPGDDARVDDDHGVLQSASDPDAHDDDDDGDALRSPSEPAAPAQPIEVIDFTGEDSDSDSSSSDEVILTATPAAIARKPSSGLLRGPLAQQRVAPSRIPVPSRPPPPPSSGDASSIVRAMGRASLSSPMSHTSSTNGSQSMRDVFAGQRYARPQSKRRSILHNQHKAKIRAKNQQGLLALKTFYQQNASSLKTAGFADAASLDSWLQYKEMISRVSTTSVAPPKSRALAAEILTQRRDADYDSLEQRRLRLILGKSRAAESRIAIKPGKEQRRLRREQQLKERRRRGILGRPALPAALAPAQEAAVRTILNDPSWKISIPGAAASHHDVVKLRPGQWMNDETITFYMTMINQRSTQAEQERAKAGYDRRRWDCFYRVHAFNSHFWAKLETSGYASVSRWTRKVNIFEKDMVLVPCNLGSSHWTCAAINFRKKRFEYYDSMAGRNRRVLSHLREYVKKEMIDKKRDGAVDLNDFQDYFASDTSPQQRNTFDCGVFVCATLEQLSRRDPHYPFSEDPPPLEPLESDDEGDDEDYDGLPRSGGIAKDGYEWNFSQKDMPYLRKRIIYEISQKALMD